MTPEQLRAYHARKGRTHYDKEYNREYNNYNSGAYAQEENEKNEGLVDRSDMPPGTFLFPRTHFGAGRFVHHFDGMTNFLQEDQTSKLPIKKERKPNGITANELSNLHAVTMNLSGDKASDERYKNALKKELTDIDNELKRPMDIPETYDERTKQMREVHRLRERYSELSKTLNG